MQTRRTKQSANDLDSFRWVRSARTKWCKPFLSDLDACEGLEDVRRVVEGEEVVEAWGSRDRNVAALLEYTS